MSAYYQAACLRVPTTHTWKEVNPAFSLICSNSAPPEQDMHLLPEVSQSTSSQDSNCWGTQLSAHFPGTFQHMRPSSDSHFFAQFKPQPETVYFVSQISKSYKHVRVLPKKLGAQVGVQV